MSQNISHPNIATRRQPRSVWFNGTSALKKGQAVAYNRDYGTAANADGRRDREVELLSQSNNLNFAGVAAQDYAANALGQQIAIFEPGSVCEVSTLIATTVNSTRLSAHLSGSNPVINGLFAEGGLAGRGRALALQSVTALASATSTTPGVVANSTDGSASVDASGTTITDTGAFTYAAVGDRLIVVGGATTASGAAKVTVGEYTVSAVTDANTIVVSSAMAAAASIIHYYLVRGYPTVLALLEDGVESGCAEFVTVWTDGSGTTPITSMVGGWTRLCAGITLGTADAIETLADGTFIGQTKLFSLEDDLTTNDYLLTVTTGKQLDGSTALQTAEFDGVGDELLLEWMGLHWKAIANTGTAFT